MSTGFTDVALTLTSSSDGAGAGGRGISRTASTLTSPRRSTTRACMIDQEKECAFLIVCSRSSISQCEEMTSSVSRRPRKVDVDVMVLREAPTWVCLLPSTSTSATTQPLPRRIISLRLLLHAYYKTSIHNLNAENTENTELGLLNCFSCACCESALHWRSPCDPWAALGLVSASLSI
jgi:hypothetical protein